jgi:hypothetical protein
MYDASTPSPDPHLEVCGFYIGGDTPHVWTDEEIVGQSARWRLPIYVCDDPAKRNPSSDAADAVAWLRAHNVPAGSALGLDFETAVDGAYVTAFDTVVRAAGWTLLLYGSLSTVVQNPRPSAGYWTASWSGEPHMDADAAATQYASDTQLGIGYDLSLVADSLVLWDTQDPPAPAPAPTVQEDDDMQQIEPLSAHPGEYAYPTVGKSAFRLAADGYGEVAQLRVVVWTGTKPVVHDGVRVGGGFVDIPLDAATTSAVTVRREDAGGFPVGVLAY